MQHALEAHLYGTFVVKGFQAFENGIVQPGFDNGEVVQECFAFELLPQLFLVVFGLCINGLEEPEVVVLFANGVARCK